MQFIGIAFNVVTILADIVLITVILRRWNK